MFSMFATQWEPTNMHACIHTVVESSAQAGTKINLLFKPTLASKVTEMEKKKKSHIDQPLLFTAPTSNPLTLYWDKRNIPTLVSEGQYLLFIHFE